MATVEEISFIKEQFASTMPKNLNESVNTTKAGIGMVLSILDKSTDKEVTCGDISKIMSVSTARVASLLNKMKARGLILRVPMEKDKRVTIVKLTDLGKNDILRMNAAVDSMINTLIEELGMEKLNQFFALSSQITTALKTKTVLPKLLK